MRVWFYTFGCKVNQYETELLRQSFESRGWLSAVNFASADVCVINSCTVTSQSDLKLRQLVHRIRRENPTTIIALCGCYPQAFPDCAETLPEADIIVGSGNKQSLPSAVENYVKSRLKIADIQDIGRDYPASESLSAIAKKTRAVIKIQDGCDRFCSYCIIPYARGRSRSKTLDQIRQEAKTLAAAGHKELIAVGINLSDYGKNTEYDLADAVKAISLSGAARIRLGSLEPEELSESIINRLAEIPNLCPHFHLALQSGCDKTLREMRRKYDRSSYSEIVRLLRNRFPGCAVTTDIMVGFPGESDRDFSESHEFVKSIAFADAHIFPYSIREGTPAAKRTDQIPEPIKEIRAKMMSEAVGISKTAYSKSLVGSVQQVLFEKEKAPDFHQGHSSNYQVVKVKRFTDTLFREMRDVRIISAERGYLLGEIVQR